VKQGGKSSLPVDCQGKSGVGRKKKILCPSMGERKEGGEKGEIASLLTARGGKIVVEKGELLVGRGSGLGGRGFFSGRRKGEAKTPGERGRGLRLPVGGKRDVPSPRREGETRALGGKRERSTIKKGGGGTSSSIIKRWE